MQSDYEHELKFTDLFGLSFVHISLDVSSNQVTFRIQEQWDENYLYPTTKEYVNLKQQMIEKVNEINQHFLLRTTTSFHNLIKFSSPKWGMLVKTSGSSCNLSLWFIFCRLFIHLFFELQLAKKFSVDRLCYPEMTIAMHTVSKVDL